MKKIVSLILVAILILSLLPMAVFAEGNSGEIVLPPDCFHSYIYTDNEDGETHTVTCSRCDYSATEAHTFIEGVCVCGAEEQTVIDNAYCRQYTVGLEAATYLKLSYTKNSLSSFTSYYLEIVAKRYDMTTHEYYNETIKLDPSVSGSAVNFFLYDIKAAQLNDELTLQIKGVNASGEPQVGRQEKYKVTDWLYDMLDKVAAGTTDAQLIQRQLFVDMLVYAGYAQRAFSYNTDNLADAKLTDTQLAWCRSDVSISSEVPTSESITGAVATRASTTIDIAGAIGMNIYYRVPTGTDISNYALKITWSDKYLGVTETQTGETVIPSSQWTVYNAGSKNTTYKISFYGFSAPQLVTVAGLQVFNGAAAVSAKDYVSIESLASALLGNATYADFMQKMMNYSASADAYFVMAYKLDS